MPSTQRARSGVPLEQRSAVPSIPGIPAWGAVAVAVGAAFLGVVLDAFRGTELTITFAGLYVLGCIAAVLAVRNRGVFTAIAQPPLIIFFGVPVAYQFLTEGSGATTIKDFVLNAAVPLVNRFPLMLITSIAVLAIGIGRVVLARGTRRAPKPARSTPARERAAKAPRERTAAPQEPQRSPDPKRGRTSRAHEEPPRERLRPEREPTPPARDPVGRRPSDSLRRRPTEAPRYRDDGQLYSDSREDPRRRIDRTPPDQPRTSSRRAMHTAEPVSRDTAQHDTAQRDTAQRDTGPRQTSPDDAPAYEPRYIPRAARRTGADNPALQRHSAPQVRYRDRRD